MTDMKLSRIVPRRRKTLTASWCMLQWMQMSDKFRSLRARSRKNLMDTCYWCGHAYENGDWIALASFNEVTVGNRALCQECAGLLMQSEEVSDDS